MKKNFWMMLSVLSLGFIGSYGLVAYAHTVPGWDEPYNIDAYYSLTEISWADSPSPFALQDLARNVGTVYDYTRHMKSIILGDKFEKTADTDASQTENEEINSASFSKEIFTETSAALEVIGGGTEKVSKTVSSIAVEKYLRQGNDDDWESYNQDSYDHSDKYKFLDTTYKNFVNGAKSEIDESEKVLNAAKKIFNHANIAEGNLQIYQAQNELKTLLAYELARQNALDMNFEQMQAVYQASEYDEKVESAYIDSITKFDVVDPYDEVNYKLLNDEYNYEKPKSAGMPDFK